MELWKNNLWLKIIGIGNVRIDCGKMKLFKTPLFYFQVGYGYVMTSPLQGSLARSAGRKGFKSSPSSSSKAIMERNYVSKTISYNCHKCDRTFSTPSGLSNHVYAKHEDPATKLHKCTVCSKSFMSKASLSEHFKVHSGRFSKHCPYCRKGFNNNDHLKGHISSQHTGIKMNECTLCSRKFHYKYQVDRHIKKDHR